MEYSTTRTSYSIQSYAILSSDITVPTDYTVLQATNRATGLTEARHLIVVVV